MSVPNIPDIDPVNNIDLCDAANLLLTSVVMEEISLPKLTDVEKSEIDAVLCSDQKGSHSD